MIELKKHEASKPRASMHHKQAGTRLCDRVLHRSKRLSVADSNINGQLAAAMRITKNLAHFLAHKK